MVDIAESINIEEAEKLVASATPLPWRIGKLSGWHPANEAWASKVRLIEAGPENTKATINVAESGIDGEPRNSKPEEDFALMVYAVNNLPALLEELRELRELRDAWDDAVAEARFND